MDAYYFTFQSMTQAQSAATMLMRHGFTSTYMRAPKSISFNGCGYAVQIGLRDVYAGLFVLRSAGVFPRKIFRTIGNGEAKEVVM